MHNIEEIEHLASHMDTNLPKLTEIVWSIKQSNPKLFAQLPEWTSLGQRRTAALVAIGRVFGGGKIEPELMIAIGWTKLDAIAPYVARAVLSGRALGWVLLGTEPAAHR